MDENGKRPRIFVLYLIKMIKLNKKKTMKKKPGNTGIASSAYWFLVDSLQNKNKTTPPKPNFVVQI